MILYIGHMLYRGTFTFTGNLIIEASVNGLKQIELLPCLSEEDSSRARMVKVEIHFRGESPLYEKLGQDLRTYLSGSFVDLPYPVDWHGMTPFTRQVLEIAGKIPWGKTETYGDLSSHLRPKGSPRAVGRALGRNPVPIIIPCHRIIRRGGALGGFSSGTFWKKLFLNLEHGLSPGIQTELLWD
jgi:methylated-DNA-[protein]-cysteine S-methyltransferase